MPSQFRVAGEVTVSWEQGADEFTMSVTGGNSDILSALTGAFAAFVCQEVVDRQPSVDKPKVVVQLIARIGDTMLGRYPEMADDPDVVRVLTHLLQVAEMLPKSTEEMRRSLSDMIGEDLLARIAAQYAEPEDPTAEEAKAAERQSKLDEIKRTMQGGMDHGQGK